MIYNKTKNQILSRHPKICKNFLAQAIGLMFSKKRTMLFVWKKSKKRSIHTFFVFFPIDLIYLNKDKRVVEIKRNLPSFNVYTPKSESKYLIEIPSQKKKIKFSYCFIIEAISH